MFRRLRSGHHRTTFATAFSMPLALVASMLIFVPPALAAMPQDSGPPPGEKAAVRAPLPKPLPRTDNARSAALTASRSVTWPGRALAEIDMASGVMKGALSSATPGRVRAAGTPVSVGPAERLTAGGSVSASAALDTPDKMRVEVLGHEAATAIGVDGLLLKVSRADGVAKVGAASVQVDYSQFRQAYGGDWAGRLRLVRLPGCALSTPGLAQCQGEPLKGVNDTAAGTVRADILLDGDSSSALRSADAASMAGTLVALSSGEGGEGGSYGETGLSASATWQSGGSTGDFSWRYSMKVPPSLGGPSPQIGMSYSSGNVDGRVSSVNSQPSWAGEGFDYWPGYVERKYKDCQSDGWLAYDNCWFTDNATISLNGKASELVKDDATGVWRLKRDDGSKVERLTGADNGDKNRDGSTEGEYWKVTTSDGTQYFFGLHKLSSLPGNAGVTGMPGTPDSNATWTMPVVGNNTGEPCHLTHPSNSSCDQAWRWNLDYVVDTHGNTMAYFYVKENNRYRSLTVGADREYTRGGYVDRIEYGLRAGQTWSATAAPARVKFTAVERCVPGSACVKPGDYPDVPFDQECLSGACTKVSPTFWTTKRLSKITTQVKRGSAYDDVDSWTFTHLFPATGDAIGTPVLWLSQIMRTGHLGSTDEAMPPTVFDGAPMDNRVAASGNQVRKWRMTHIYNETGGAVVITYTPHECTPTNQPTSPQANTKRCMPVWWTPPGGDEGLYWFHKYVVSGVNEQDLNGVGASTAEAYNYVGTPAWHYDEDTGLVPPEKKTWGQWRGYGLVERRTGTTADGKTLEVKRFYRGMDGDRNDPVNASSFRPQSETNITDGLGGTTRDYNELAGQIRERVSYSGDGGTVLNRSVSDGWVSPPTAQAVFPWATVKATFTEVTNTRVQSKTHNSTRVNQTVKTVTNAGLVTKLSDLGDENASGDEECTRITYAPNTTFAIRTERYALDCNSVPALNPDGTLVTEVASQDDVISDQRTLYDNATTWSTNMTVTKGDVTSIEDLKSWSPTSRQYVTVTRIEHDVYGRGLKSYDGAGKMTETVYTPATGGPVTEMKVINPLLHGTVTKFEIGNGAPTEQIDPNGRKIVIEYDGLGRVTRNWLPGRTYGVDPPSAHTDHKIRASGGLNYTTTRSIRPDGSYNVTIELYDGLMRPIQTQISAPGGGRTVASTFYNSRGQVVKQHGAFYDPASPTASYQPFQDASIPAQMRTIYDGTGRATAEAFEKYGVEQWRSSATFEGDRITSIPPNGGMPTQVTFDSLGRATELKEFKTTSPSGAYTSTQYKFNRRSQQTEVWDAAGNKWIYKYDIRGRLIESSDPDQGKTRLSYNDANDLVYKEKSIDPGTNVGAKTYFEYDDLGRMLRTRKDAANGPVVTESVYDTLVKGAPTSATHYVNGHPYTTAITEYDTAYRAKGSSITLPSAEGLLAGTYTFGVTYNADGSPATMTTPLMGDLPEETLSYTYTPEGLPLTMSSGLGTYVNTAFYSPYGEATKLVLGVSPNRVNLNYSYEEGSRRLASTWVTRDGLLGNVHKDVYSYNNVGDLTQLVTTGSGQTAETQCFKYDEKRRLTRAFTPSSADCNTAPTNNNLGGPAPYWTDWKYDTSGTNGEITVGNRTEQVKHFVGATGVDHKTEYFYAAAGASKPHVLDQTKVTDAGGTRWYDYDYDQSGNTIKRPGPTGAIQQLSWNSEGRLAQVEEGGSTTSYIYDAAGNRLLQKTPEGTTVYLGNTELKLTGTVKTAARYYRFGEMTVAVRTAGALKWLSNNSKGTATVSIDSATTSTVDRRRFTPFGEPRGSQPAWTGNQGYVGGVNDATGLVHLGAREYDPGIGRFISVDPIMDQGDPQQMHGYAYANNNPTTYADPSGLLLDSGGGGGGPSTSSGEGTGGTGDGEVVLPAELQAMLDEARRIQKMSLLDVILDAGGEILKELLGINDILNCFQKGDILACVSIVANIIPWAKLFKLPKIVKAIERAWSAVHAFWERLKWAKRVFSQVEEYMQLARKAAAEAAEKLAAAKRAKAEAEAAAKAAKARAEAEARKAAKQAADNKAKKAAKDACEHSFAAGTLVLMADGTTKPIEKVRTGDKVESTDDESGKTAGNDVTTRHENQDEDLTTLTVVDETGQTSTIETTWSHPFWNEKSDQWVDASHLVPGDELRVHEAAGQGRSVRVASVSNFVATATMFDLTVDVVHTYYVFAGTTPVLVHNCTFSNASDKFDKHVLGRDDSGQLTRTPDMPEYDIEDLDAGFAKYVADAKKLMCSDEIPAGVRETRRTLDGVTTIIRHDVDKGTIGMRVGNDITTFFRPDDPWDYFRREQNR